MWIYSQSTGELRHDAGPVIATGYSGAPGAVNDGSKEQLHNVGPIPRGSWVVRQAFTDSHRGPLAMRLTPSAGTETFGRSDFLIHADRKDAATNPRAASEGCIILSAGARLLISGSLDRILRVVD